MSRITTRDVESKVLSDLAAQSINVNSETNGARKRFKIYEISHHDNNLLYNELDKAQDGNPEFWKDLAKEMGLSATKIKDIEYRHKQGKIQSLVEELIGIYADQDRSVNQLFIVLSRLKQFRAMDIIKKLVDEKYYKHYETEKTPTTPPVYESVMGPALSVLLQNISLSQQNAPADLPLVLNMSSSTQQSTMQTSQSVMTPSLASSEIDKREFLNAVPEVDYNELTEATDNWNKDKVLGRGGFGTVFYGEWKCTKVAIKRIEPRDKNSRDNYKLELKQSMNELRFLNSCRHDNVLPLYGYSLSGAHPCLIYQLMPGGTLEQRLYAANSLTWDQKYYIALGTARGLQFLHTFRSEKPLIHGDIKPANILLDHCLSPKIGDFGLTRESPSTKPVEISKVYGTRPYLPAEFIVTRCLSTKIDTYSFGIVLYEMATKKKVLDHNRNPTHLVDLMKKYHAEGVSYTDVIDSTHPFDQLGFYIFSIFTTLGQECTAVESSNRPEMKEVCRRIESCSQPQQQQQQPVPS